MRIIGLLGNAGVGKDTIAEMLAPVHFVDLDGWRDIRTSKHPSLRERAVQIALADPLKETCRRVYDFTLEQLWGPSEKRNAPDKRYPREGRHVFARTDSVFKYEPEPDVGCTCAHCGVEYAFSRKDEPCVTYLTPREALQQLGTEWGRRMWPDTWISFGLRRARRLLEEQRIAQPAHALTFKPNYIIERCSLVTISDVRFLNEVKAIRAQGGEVWKIVRPTLDTSGNMYTHATELEQKMQAAAIDELVTQTITNDGSLDDLRGKVESALGRAGL